MDEPAGHLTRGFFFCPKMEEIMSAFKSFRVAHEFIQTNLASPEKVFPLLCPVREADWIPGWQYDLIYSDSGVAELGCVFTTPNPATSVRSGEHSGKASETTWIVTDYDPAAFRIAYVWINPGMVITELRIQLTQGEEDTTRSHIRFRYTGLSADGNRQLTEYDRTWFDNKMRNWESAINHYLRVGKKTDS